MDFKVPKQDYEKMVDGYAMDLIAFYKVLQDEVIGIVSESKDRSPEDIIAEIDKLF